MMGQSPMIQTKVREIGSLVLEKIFEAFTQYVDVGTILVM